MVLGIAEVDLLVRLRPGAGTGRERHRLGIPVDDLDCGQEIPLPIGPRTDGPGLLEQRPHAGHLHWRLPERVIVAHGHPPVAHHALRIGLDHQAERLLGLLVGEGVEESDREVELLLRRGGAGNGKGHPAELTRVARFVDVRGGRGLRRGRLLQPAREPGEGFPTHLGRDRVADLRVEDAAEAVPGAHRPVDARQLLLEGTHPVGRGARVEVAGEGEQGPRRQEREHPLGVEVPQQPVDEVVDTVLPQLAVRDQVLIPRETRDRDHGRDPLVDGGQPPGARAPHRHSGGSDARAVDLRPRQQVIESYLVVPHEHAPQGAAEPQVELEQALLLLAAGLERARGPGADPIAVPEGIG